MSALRPAGPISVYHVNSSVSRFQIQTPAFIFQLQSFRILVSTVRIPLIPMNVERGALSAPVSMADVVDRVWVTHV